MSVAWLVAPGAIRTARVIVSGVAMSNVPPYGTLLGALVIVGRGPLNRYGGE